MKNWKTTSVALLILSVALMQQYEIITTEIFQQVVSILVPVGFVLSADAKQKTKGTQ